MKIRPLQDRLVVKRIEEELMTKSGLHIPESAKEKPSQGDVIAVGNGTHTETGYKVPLEVKVGDRILYAKHSGSEVKLDGVSFLILRETDVIGVLDNDEK
jgi:chaperonin GroES